MTKTFGQVDNPETVTSGDECGVDVHNVSSLQDEAKDEGERWQGGMRDAGEVPAGGM